MNLHPLTTLSWYLTKLWQDKKKMDGNQPRSVNNSQNWVFTSRKKNEHESRNFSVISYFFSWYYFSFFRLFLYGNWKWIFDFYKIRLINWEIICPGASFIYCCDGSQPLFGGGISNDGKIFPSLGSGELALFLSCLLFYSSLKYRL